MLTKLTTQMWLGRIEIKFNCVLNQILHSFKNVLLSDTSSDEEDLDGPVSNEHLQDLLKMHVDHKNYRHKFGQDREVGL